MKDTFKQSFLLYVFEEEEDVKRHFVLLFVFTLPGDGMVECARVSNHLSGERPEIKQVGKEEFLFRPVTDSVILKSDVTSAAPPGAGVDFLSELRFTPVEGWSHQPGAWVPAEGRQGLQAGPAVLPCSAVNMSEEQG